MATTQVTVAQNLTSTITNATTSDTYVTKTANDSTTRSKFSTQGFAIIDGTADKELEINDITTVKDVLITSDQEVSIKLDGTGNPATSFKEKFLIQGGTITSLHISNASGNTANIFLEAAGE